jgi:DNA-binding response OmpR family regulator
MNINNARPGTGERQRILVVDNNRDMKTLLNHTLEAEGYDTVIVDDGDAALHLLDKMEPDLVILDETMSEKDSLEILDQMREHSDVPIIMLTSEYEVGALRTALAHGADDFVRKPFGTRAFLARIRAKLRRARQNVA